MNFPDWSSRNAEALVIGKIDPAGEDRLEMRFRLFDVQKQAQLASYSYVVTPAQLRATAHRIADVIYEKLTGDKGVFSTKITYVVKRGTRFELQVADADGYNAQSILASNEPIMSPSWSPDGSRIAYVSFDQKKPIVVVQNLAQGTTHVVANFRGNNSAPPWSPDGQSLAVALSKDGLTQIYRIPAGGGAAERPHRFLRHRHAARLLARRPVDRLHLGPRRHAADLPHARGRAARRSASPSRATTTSARATAPTAASSRSCSATAAAIASRRSSSPPARSRSSPTAPSTIRPHLRPTVR